MKENEMEKITAAILALYQSFELGDIQQFKLVSHPDIRTINIGNSNEAHIFQADDIITNTILGLSRAKDQIPGFFAKWVDIEFISITIHDLIASVETRYKMEMPESYGLHSSFIQLIKDNENWKIIQIIDRGLEVYD